MKLFVCSVIMFLGLARASHGQDPSLQRPGDGIQIASLPIDLPPLPQSHPAQATNVARAALTLSDLQGMAFQNNPVLSVAAARIDAARGRQLQAGLYPNPVVGYQGAAIGNLGTSGKQGGFFKQQLVTARKLKLDAAAASRDVQVQHFRFHAQEQRVLTDVEIRFYAALAAQRRYELTQGLVEIGNNLVRATEKLIEGRLRTQNDLLQAEIRADEAQILLGNSVQELNESWRRLMAIVGAPAMVVTPLAGELNADVPIQEWASCWASVLAGNPELAAARAQAEQAKILITRARKEPIPNVDVSVSVQHIAPTDSDVANVQIGIPLPIFNRNQGNISAAEAEWIAACRDVQRVEMQLQDRLAVAYRRYASAAQQADRYGVRIVPKAQRSLELVTSGYEKGQVDYLTLLTAQQTYLQANLAYINSLRELHTSLALINGQLLDGSLTAR